MLKVKGHNLDLWWRFLLLYWTSIVIIIHRNLLVCEGICLSRKRNNLKYPSIWKKIIYTYIYPSILLWQNLSGGMNIFTNSNDKKVICTPFEDNLLIRSNRNIRSTAIVIWFYKDFKYTRLFNDLSRNLVWVSLKARA